MNSSFDRLSQCFTHAKTQYDGDNNSLEAIGLVAEEALQLIVAPGVTVAEQGQQKLEEQIKIYEVRRSDNRLSRPIRKDIFIVDPKEFRRVWGEIINGINTEEKTLRHPKLDAVLYTAAISFAVAYDLFRPSSRKTPGTYFEVLIGALLGAVSNLPRAKQIALPESKYKVPTDIVIKGGMGKPTLVIPTKITTRERVVQPWAHQRILDDAFGRGRYKSVLVAVSELQREKEHKVNEICVPGQIELYQKYLAQVYGMYYLDPPAAYMKSDFVKIVPTKRLSALLGDDLALFLKG